MKITYLIGNGFDVNLGLKSRYTDFYPQYIESNQSRYEDDCVKRFCGLIKADYETWADFELAFAQNITGTLDDVKEILYDFSENFTTI